MGVIPRRPFDRSVAELEELGDDLSQRQRDHGEEVAAQPQRRRPQQCPPETGEAGGKQ